MNRSLTIILIVAILSLAWWRLQPTEEASRRTRLLMGTVVEIIAEGQNADLAINKAFAEMERLDRLLSRHKKNSEVSQLSARVKGVKISAETAAVINMGLAVADDSDGAFDMTLGRLKNLWALDTTEPTIPSPQEIKAALSDGGPGALRVDGLKLRKQSPELQVDLGGIAKGYIVDRAASVLKEHGIANAAINAGGDMYLLGQKTGRPWRIGIQNPRASETVLDTVHVSNLAVVTSGDYERFFEQDGIRYHHIFDPRSGMPARGCRSVTIIADSVALGDALATAVFVLGPEKGLRLLEKYPQAAGLVVAADGSLHESPGWENYREEQ